MANHHSAAESRPIACLGLRACNRATLVFALLTASGLIALNLAGREDLSPEMDNRGAFGPFLTQFVPRVEHGWPLTFVRREGESLYGLALWDARRWGVTEDVSWFSPHRAAINVLICLVLWGILASMFAAWRVRRCSIWQVRMSELLLLMTAAAVLCGLWAKDRQATQGDRATLETIDLSLGRKVEHPSAVSYRARWERPERSWWSRFTGQWPERVVSLEVRDERLESLLAMRGVKAIHYHRRISQEELQLLTRWPELEALNLSFISPPRASSQRFVEMPLLPNLRALNLFGADFRGDGLGQLVSLEVLDVSQTYVDDAALPAIARLPRLRELSLEQTRITSLGLKHLASMTQLQTLSLRSCNLDSQAVAQLRAALPDCDIHTRPEVELPRFAPALFTPSPAAAAQMSAAPISPGTNPAKTREEQLERLVRQLNAANQRQQQLPKAPARALPGGAAIPQSGARD